MYIGIWETDPRCISTIFSTMNVPCGDSTEARLLPFTCSPRVDLGISLKLERGLSSAREGGTNSRAVEE